MGARLVGFAVQRFAGARAIGKTIRVPVDMDLEDDAMPGLWKAMRADGSLEQLLGLEGRLAAEPDTVGWMGDFIPGEAEFTYLAGVLFAPGTTVPEGFAYRDIDPCDMAVGRIQETDGEEGGNMFANASDHVGRARDAHGYTYDPAHGLFELEYYHHGRFYTARERGERPVLDFYSPCRRAGAPEE